MLKRVNILFFICLVPVFLTAQIDVSFTINHDSVCSGTPIQFTSAVTSGNTSPKIYLWNFGDGTISNLANPSHVYNPPGCGIQQYNVMLIVTDTTGGLNISDSFDRNVHVKRRPNPQLIDLLNDPDFSNCDRDPTPENADFPIQVQNTTTENGCVLGYTLNWGDGSDPVNLPPGVFTLNHTYIELGAFSLTLTAIASNGCNGTTTYIVKNQSNPAIGLTTDGGTAGCAPKTYSFTLSNYALNSPGTTYLWDFGDNSPRILWTQDSVLLNNGIISHTFTTTSCGKINNEFIITVTASNSCSSTSATVSGIKMWSAPIPDFIITPALGCENSGLFCFSNTSIPGAYGSNCNRTTTYFWDFGNGKTSTEINPQCQTYPASGPHTIRLTATNSCGSAVITKDIRVQSPPAAIAEADQDTSCVPFPVVFTSENSTGSDLLPSWSVSPASGWNFINGTTGSSQKPELQFTVAGDYTVTLTVSNTCGSDNTSVLIHAMDIPSINLPVVPDDCFPFRYSGNASYLDKGSDITLYQWTVNPANGWSFESPSTSGSPNPQILFSQAGTYQITVKATNTCGTGDSISNQFEVFTPVDVNAGNDTSVCISSGNFQLSGKPSGGTWTGNHVTATGVFSPVASGAFTLTYRRGAGNCTTEDQVVVSVIPNPVVNAGSDIILCMNEGLRTLSGIPAGGIWSGTGIINTATGVFDPLISGTGTFLITYLYTDNSTKCSNSDEMAVTVLSYPIVIAEDVTFCNQPIPEQLTAIPAGGIWSGPNVSATGLFTPNGIGNFVLLYSYTGGNGCSGSDAMTVSVVEPDKTVSAGSDRSICSNETISMIGTPSGGTWRGTNVSPAGFFDPVLAGNYELIYSTGNGSCYRADTALVTVRPSPEADFTSSTVCFGETTVFTNQSQGGGVTMTSWFWEFGDNTTSQAQNPGHTYTVPGLYSSMLVVINESGCRDSVAKPVEVMELPAVNFSFGIPACTNSPVYFSNNSSNAISFVWDFGDGNTSELFEPAHTYAFEGSFQVKLTATSGFGCTYSDSSVIIITGPPPQPFFQLSSREGCSPLTTFITIDLSQYNAGSSYHWDFGNGLAVDSLRPPDSIVYIGSLTGDTVIHIRFESYNYCDYLVYSDSILVHAKPLSRFEMLHTWDCSPVEVLFRNVSTSFPDSLFWDFGDGTTSTEFEPVHTFTTGANSTVYPISLFTKNGCGSDTLTRDLLVKPNTVHAFFTVNNFKGCEGDAFCFQNYSTDASVLGISNLSWDFGDGQGSSTENPCHIYNQAGIYTVKLNVDNGCGYDETFDTIEILPVPQIEISSVEEACVGETLSFAYTSNIEIGDRIWHFGDGDSSVLSNPYHTYTNSGTYEVILSGVSAFGFPACIGTSVKQIIIKPKPEAFILPDTSGCVPLQITFQGDMGSSHLWTFGDNTAISSNPTHVFDSAGLFLVKLTSENSNRCKDSDSIEIRVFPSPQSQFTFTSTGGYPEYLTFTNSSVGETECFWNFGNGREFSACDVNEPIEYSNNDTYIIMLVTMNQFGCMDTAIVSYPVNFKGLYVPNALIPEHPDPDENLFLPKGIGIAEYTIQIYDTWGNLIWQSTALQNGMPSEGWNGRDANGNLFPQDVYAWRISAKFADGTYWSGNNGKTYGTVTLIR